MSIAVKGMQYPQVITTAGHIFMFMFLNVLRQDLKTVLIIPCPLEVLPHFPVKSFPTILLTTKAEPVTFLGSLCSCAPGGSPLKEGDGGLRLFRFWFSIISALGHVKLINFVYPFKLIL